MIQVPRTGKPAILAAKEAQWKKAITAAADNKERKRAQGRYCHRTIKSALVEMFDGKCAYCESHICHIDYGHIEHFKPKSVLAFHELAVEWGNLLLACGICNGADHKGVKFPTVVEDGPLIDPSAEDPSVHLKFEFDGATGLANVLAKSPRGQTTITIMGLDRLELLRHRSGVVKKLVFIARSYANDPHAREIIDASVGTKAEYRAFATRIRNQAIAAG